MNHIHGPNCGCKEYAGAEDGEDLYDCVDIERVVCLNERIQNSCQQVIKIKSEKYDKTKILQANEDDPEILLIVPFSTIVKLKTICLIAESDETAPELLKIFQNQENIDFQILENADPIQEFELISNQDGKIEYAVKQQKFQNVSKLIMHISAQNKDNIGLSYVGFKGHNTKLKKQIVNAVYEAIPQKADHKTAEEYKQNQIL